MLRTLCCFLTFALLPLFGQPASAQEPKKASIAFDIRIDELRKTELWTTLEAEQGLQEMLNEFGPDLDSKSLKRIFGAANVPDDPTELIGMFMGGMMGSGGPPKMIEREEGGDPFGERNPFGDGCAPQDPQDPFGDGPDLGSPAAFGGGKMSMPLDFFVRLQFSDNTVVDAAITKLAAESEKATIGDRTAYRPPRIENVSASKVDAKTLEIGTDAYIKLQTRRYFTDELLAAWKKVGPKQVRLAIDLEASRDLVTQGREQLEASPFAGPFRAFIKLIDEIETVAITGDLKANEMLGLQITSPTAGGAKKLTDGLNALATIFKPQMKEGLKMEMPNEKMRGALEKVVDDLTVKNEDVVSRISIEKPENMGELVESMREQAKETSKLNDMKMAILAIHNFHDTYRGFPWDKMSQDISWRAKIVPFMEGDAGIDTDKAWDDESNKAFADLMVFGLTNEKGQSDLTLIIPDKLPATFANVTDGTSNTICLVKGLKTVSNWMKPDETTPQEAVAAYKKLKDGEFLLAAMYDGSVRKFVKGTDSTDDFEAALDPADGK